MKKLVVRCRAKMRPDELKRIADRIREDWQQGCIIVPPGFFYEVIDVDDAEVVNGED